MISATIVADSTCTSENRLTTFVLTYPRFIHAEFMTHRMFSRNASSSRAIPVSKFIDAITNNPAMPTSFSKNCKGMQSMEEIQDQGRAEELWLEARDSMMEIVQKLADLGVHKQHANRLLEPFQHITVVCTATDYANFFSLRTHKDAQPEFQELATLMWEAYSTNIPKMVKLGSWHLPFITEEEKSIIKDSDDLIKMSVARCARVSYNMHDGSKTTLEKDKELYNKLVGSIPLHASPTEHQASPGIDSTSYYKGNFKGWIQYRKTLMGENVLSFHGPE